MLLTGLRQSKLKQGSGITTKKILIKIHWVQTIKIKWVDSQNYQDITIIYRLKTFPNSTGGWSQHFWETIIINWAKTIIIKWVIVCKNC